MNSLVMSTWRKWRWGKNTGNSYRWEKTEEKMENVIKPLVSSEISDEEEIKTIAV